MKIKVSEATGRVLDWLAAKAEGARGVRLHTYRSIDPLPPAWVVDWERGWVELSSLAYSTDWAQGGPIIDREDIGFQKMEGGPYQAWKNTCIEYACWSKDSAYAEGPTKLIAAMRCFVISRLGDEVDVPEELLT